MKSTLPRFVSKAVGERELKSGTVIHLVARDRLTSGFRRPVSFEQKMLEHLGLVYRGILRLCQIFVSGTRVEPVDPLFLDPNGRHYDVDNGYKAEALPKAEFKFTNSHGEEGAVRLRFSYMHPL